MKTKNLLAFALAATIIGVLFAPTSASASLLGDEVTISINGAFPFSTQSVTVDQTPEVTWVSSNHQDCLPAGEDITIDIDASEIWILLFDEGVPYFMCDDNGPLQTIEITISDMDWVGQDGKIKDITVQPDENCSFLNAEVLGPHSVKLTFPNFFFTPIPNSCHFDLETDHVVGGELLSINTTALLVAGVQTNFAWILGVLVAGIGVSVIILRRK